MNLRPIVSELLTEMVQRWPSQPMFDTGEVGFTVMYDREDDCYRFTNGVDDERAADRRHYSLVTFFMPHNTSVRDAIAELTLAVDDVQAGEWEWLRECAGDCKN